MLWKREEPDPLEAKRRHLAEQERALVEKQRVLREQLRNGGAPGLAARVGEPPVWRMEDEPPDAAADPLPVRRHLARQRRRDRLFFFACIGLLLLVIAVLLWVAYVHVPAPVNAA